MAMIESRHRATSDPEARKDVRKRMEKDGIEYLLFWFTDIEGHLKSFAITPSEAEGALDDGMGFDGSSITDFNGFVGVAEVQGTGSATNANGTTETLVFDTDMRFMSGVYVGQDNNVHKGAFGFV